MKFYISPENRTKLEKKLNSMFKHLETKPLVIISSVTKLMTDVVFNGKHNRAFVDALEVEIEDIKTSDWTLVATVDYKIGELLMCDSRYFKDIPSQYGLTYTKCDHCGSTHKNRIESHILYNEKTGVWMQVGSTCINKMVDGGKYLNGLMIKIMTVIDNFGGCTEDEWYRGGWYSSSNYCRAAVSMTDALMVCNEYMEEESETWSKSEYNDCGTRVSDGTNLILMNTILGEKHHETLPYIDEDFINTIKSYWDSKDYGEVYEEKTLIQKIKDAFENEYISAHEMYIPWFAITYYKNDISRESFEEKIKNLGIEKGQEFNFFGSIEAINPVESIDWRGRDTYVYDIIFIDDNTGLKFMKQVAYTDTVEKYKTSFGKYIFTGTIKYIAYKRQYIGFGGRLKKTVVKKEKKSKKAATVKD